MVTRVHLDTDLGGDPDDVCALAMLLGWPDVEITGITTTLDVAGRRAAYVNYCLSLVGRGDIPVAAGAGVSLTTLHVADPVFDDERFWPLALAPRPSPPGAALDLLHQSIEAGASVHRHRPMHQPRPAGGHPARHARRHAGDGDGGLGRSTS